MFCYDEWLSNVIFSKNITLPVFANIFISLTFERGKVDDDHNLKVIQEWNIEVLQQFLSHTYVYVL